MRRLLIALSGARPEILERCRTEHGKFEGIGGAVLTTGVLAVISMTFALHSALGVPLYLSIPASLVWGLAIVSLDRWLVSTMRADAPRRWPLALPRLMMAVLLGLVISTPLVLQIFKSEIDAQIVEIKQDRANKFTAEQNREAVGQEVVRLRKSVADLQSVIDSGGDKPLDPEQDPRIRSLQAERQTQTTQARKHYDEWQCQLYGGPKCPRKGDGVLAKTSKSNYDKANKQVAKINRQIAERRQELRSNDEDAKRFRLDSAKADLPKVRAQLDSTLQRQEDLQRLFDAENRATNGLLIRLQALDEVSGQDLTLRLAHILLFLLFLLIECLPIAVKLMQSPGNYEKLLKDAERQEYRTARDEIIPRFSLQSASGTSGGTSGPSGTSVRPGGIWEIWESSSAGGEGSPGGVAQAPSPPTRPAPTVPEPVTPSGEQGFRDDHALRQMPDTRTIRVPESRSAAERPGGTDLFPEED